MIMQWKKFVNLHFTRQVSIVLLDALWYTKENKTVQNRPCKMQKKVENGSV